MPDLSGDPRLQIIKRINGLEKQGRESNPPPFDIESEKTLPQITVDQNNYDPGNFDVIRLSSDTARGITGLIGGVQGRWITIWNVGRFVLTFYNQSSLSDAVNRILSSTGGNLTLSPNAKIQFYYDITTERWRY